MNTPNVTKTYTKGLRNIITQTLNEDCDAYTGEVRFWQGSTEIDVTMNQTVTKLPSGDDPAWDELKGAVTADIKLTLYDIPLEEYEQLFGVTYDETLGVLVGEDDEKSTFLGISFDTTCNDGSKNKYIFFKASFTLPEIKRDTMSNEDNAISSVEINGTAYPVWYEKTDGSYGRRTMQITNSVLQKDTYNSYDKGFSIPSGV